MTSPAAPLPIGRLRRAHLRRGWRRLARRVPVVRIAAAAVLASLALVIRREDPRPEAPLLVAPVHVMSPLRLDGVVVRARRVVEAAKPVVSKWKLGMGVAPAGEAVSVEVTAYCLRGTTRRGRYVRPGIIAADPRVFPLAKYVELYVGKRYFGRFLVDDTGGAIKGTRIDIWTPTCREALLFGRRRGTAVLVPHGADPAPTPEVERLTMLLRR
jgi:3D (Asp-Asp-Asp) domain-containing protein